jgi:hypothetical protein
MLGALWLACAVFGSNRSAGRTLSAMLTTVGVETERDADERIAFTLETDDLDDDDDSDDDDADDDETNGSAVVLLSSAKSVQRSTMSFRTTTYGEPTVSVRFALGQRLSLQRPPRGACVT